MYEKAIKTGEVMMKDKLVFVYDCKGCPYEDCKYRDSGDKLPEGCPLRNKE